MLRKLWKRGWVLFAFSVVNILIAMNDGIGLVLGVFEQTSLTYPILVCNTLSGIFCGFVWIKVRNFYDGALR